MLRPALRRVCLALAPLLAFGGVAFAATTAAPPVVPVAPPPVVIPPPPGPPVVTTGLVSQLGATSAQLTGRVNPAGQPTTYYFNYGPTTAYGSTTVEAALPAATVPTSVRAKVDLLTTGAVYHYQLVATNPAGATFGVDQTFTPVAGLSRPTVTTGPPAAVVDTSATITGTLNPNGQPATYRFNYGTTTAYGLTTANQPVAAGTADVPVTATLNGLTPGLTYHYRMVASGVAGTSVGQDQAFVAGQQPAPPPPPTPPTVTTGAVADVAPQGASLSGTLNPNGQATSYAFEYGTTTAYGAATPPVNVGAGTADQLVTGILTGLTPETAYHVRLTATNATGVTQGADQTFTTTAKPIIGPAPPTTTPTTPAPPATPTTGPPAAPPAVQPGPTGAGAGLPPGPDSVPSQGPLGVGAAGASDGPRPVVSNLRVHPSLVAARRPAACVRSAGRSCPARPAAATRLTFWLSLPAAVTVTVSVRQVKPASCERASAASCRQTLTSTRVVARMTMTGFAGPNATLLRLRSRGRALTPGRYIVSAQAQAGAVRGPAARTTLRVLAG